MGPASYSDEDPAIRNRRLLRRTLMVVILGMILLLGSIQLYRYLTTGRLIINSSSKNALITVHTLTSASPIASAGSPLRTRLKAGIYSVEVSVNSYKLSRVVTVHNRQTTRLSLNPPEAIGVEPVSDTTASYIEAGPKTLYFVNSSGYLVAINNQNIQSTINNKVAFRQIVWADSSFGVGIDPSGQLYEISNGNISKLNTPFSVNAKEMPLFAVAANHTVYLEYQKQVYRQTGANQYTKIYSTTQDPTSMAASNNELVIDINPDTNGNHTTASSSIVVVPVTGSPVSANIGSYFAVPSPDGKFIAVSGSRGGAILNNSLSQVAIIATPNLENPVWLNNTTLFYTDTSTLWTYSLPTQQAELKASAPLGGTITELSLSDNGDYLYLGATHIDGQPMIDRIGLNNQPVPQLLTQLSDIMPYAGNDYFMSLTNFSAPPLIVVSAQPPLTNTNQQYVQEAQDQLSKDGVDISKLSFTFASNTP